MISCYLEWLLRDRFLVGGHGLCLRHFADGSQLQCLEDPADADVTAVAWAADRSKVVAAETTPLRADKPIVGPRPSRGIRVWDAERLPSALK